MPTMMPLMDKDTVRYITQNITPEEAEYVAGIKSTIDDTKIMETKPELCDDVIYLTKIIAFATKFKTSCNWAEGNQQYKSQIQDFQWRIEQYRQDISEIIQSIIGPIKGSDITKNVKIIEWIKNEILISVSDLFNLIFKGVKPIDDKLQNTLANIIMLTYLLGKRLGISFDEIDYKIKEKSRQGIKEEHSIET